MTVFGFLLSLAPLRYAGSSEALQGPLPSDFMTGLARDNGGTLGRGAFQSLQDMLPDIALALPDTGTRPDRKLGYGASLFNEKYQGLTARNLENRRRVLTWRNLRTVMKAADGTVQGLGPPANDPLPFTLTTAQDGVVSPSIPRPTTPQNALIRPPQTSYQAVNAEIDVPITVDGQSVRVPATTTLADMEAEFEIDIFRIFRRLPGAIKDPSTGVVDNVFTTGLKEVSQTYKGGAAAGEIGPIGSDDQRGINLVLFDPSLGHREQEVENLKAFNILPDPSQRPAVLRELLVAKYDRYDVF